MKDLMVTSVFDDENYEDGMTYCNYLANTGDTGGSDDLYDPFDEVPPPSSSQPTSSSQSESSQTPSSSQPEPSQTPSSSQSEPSQQSLASSQLTLISESPLAQTSQLATVSN